MYTYRHIRHAMFNVTYTMSSFVVLLLRMGLIVALLEKIHK